MENCQDCKGKDRLALPFRALTALGQGEEPRSTGGEAGGGGGLGQMSRTQGAKIGRPKERAAQGSEV
jgi:hypothetical protein